MTGVFVKYIKVLRRECALSSILIFRNRERREFVVDVPPPYDIWRLINLCAVSPFWRGLTIVTASYLWRTAVIDECKRLEIEAPKLLETKGKITWRD